MVLSLGFILAFIGAAVALLIGILIFSEVSDAIICPAGAGGGGGGPVANVTTFSNTGTLGTAGDAFYFIADSGGNNFVLNTTGAINEGVFQSGTATEAEQGEIRFGTTPSTWAFLQQANVGSNITSINLWINGDLVGSPHYPIFSTHTNSNPANGFSYDQGDSANTFLRIEEGGAQHAKIWSTDVPDDGQWHMLTVVFDKGAAPSTWIQYVDGVVSGSIGSSGGAFTGGGGAVVQVLTVGDQWSASGNAVTENGYFIDDLSVWNGYALTGTDVTNLYNSGVGAPGGSIGQGGTLVLYQSFDSAGVGGGGGSGQGSEECENAKDTAWTVIGILPVALFFALFAIFGALGRNN